MKQIIAIFTLTLLCSGCASLFNLIVAKYDVVILNTSQSEMTDVVLDYGTLKIPLSPVGADSAEVRKSLTAIPPKRIALAFTLQDKKYQRLIVLPSTFLNNINNHELLIIVSSNGLVSVASKRRGTWQNKASEHISEGRERPSENAQR